MSITFPISLPAAPVASAAKLRMQNIAGKAASPVTAQAQIQEWPGEWLEFDVALPPMKRAKAAAWVAALTLLRGYVGSCYYGDPSGGTPQGVATGTPLVNGAVNAASKILTLRGFTASVTGILKAGDWLSIGTGTTKRLYMNVTDATSDGSGHVSLDIFPRTREALADGAAVTLLNAQGTFRLAGNTREFDIDSAMVYGISFSLEEAI